MERWGAITLDIEDRDAFAPINLARTDFNGVDDELTQILDDEIFKSFSSCLEENMADLAHMKPVKARKNSGHLVDFGREAFGFRDKRVFPLDIDILMEMKIDTIINLGSNFDHEEFSSELFSTLSMTCRGDPLKSPSAVSDMLRETGRLVEYGGYDYIAMLLEENDFESVFRLASYPRWMMELFRRSERIDRNRNRYVIVELGERKQEVYESMMRVAQASTSSRIEAFFSAEMNFYFELYTRARPAPGCFVRRWLERYGAGGFVAK